MSASLSLEQRINQYLPQQQQQLQQQQLQPVVTSSGTDLDPHSDDLIKGLTLNIVLGSLVWYIKMDAMRSGILMEISTYYSANEKTNEYYLKYSA